MVVDPDDVRLAVCMRVYNTDWKLIRYSLGSVLRQTHRNLRLVVYRDGGDRNPWLEEQARLDSRIVYIDNDTNRGRSEAANAVMDAVPDDCDGFAFLDCDGDQFMPEMLRYAARSVAQVRHRRAWFVRVMPALRAKVDQTKLMSQLRIADAVFEFDVPRMESLGVEVVRRWTAGEGLAGQWCGLFVPTHVREHCRFETMAGCGEDTGWTRVVEAHLMERYGLWRNLRNGAGADVEGVIVHAPLDAANFYLEPMNLIKKYRDETSFNDVNGTYKNRAFKF